MSPPGVISLLDNRRSVVQQVFPHPPHALHVHDPFDRRHTPVQLSCRAATATPAAGTFDGKPYGSFAEVKIRGPAEVLLHMAARVLGRSGANGLVYGSVARLGDTRPLWSRRNADLPPKLQQRAEEVEQSRQEMILRRVQDGVVELDVGRRELVDVIDGRFEGTEGIAQRVQISRCGPVGRARCGFNLDHATKLKQFQEDIFDRPRVAACYEQVRGKVVPLLVGRHSSLSTLSSLDEPEHAEMPNGLSNDWPADPELLCELILGWQLVARRQIAAENAPNQLTPDPAWQGLTGH